VQKLTLRPYRLLAALIWQSNFSSLEPFTIKLGPLSRRLKVRSEYIRKDLTLLKEWGFLSELSLGYGQAKVAINLPPATRSAIGRDQSTLVPSDPLREV
jgi:hypothetical protein